MPQTEDLSQTDPVRGSLGDEVLCVDLRELDNSTELVRNATQETGFFYLYNVFPDATILDNILRQMERFFSLPDSDPLKIAVNARIDNRERGWTPLYQEPAYQPGTIAHVESFDCGRRTPVGGDVTNVWPGLDGFQGDVRRCWDVLEAAGKQVLESLARAAGLESPYFARRCSSHELSTLRLLHYPETAKVATVEDVGIAAHTDFECITLLMQTAPGLELRDRHGNWFDAPQHIGRFVVLIDDMLERWTNGHFVATGHRVRSTSQKRFSIVMFFAVNDDEDVAPLSQFVAPDNPAKFSPTTQRLHLYGEVDKALRNRDAVSKSRD